jgi:predicted nucleotidyltransferase
VRRSAFDGALDAGHTESMASTETEVPTALLNRIIEVWQPLAIWLFGSRARGDAREDSDWDLMVVVPDDALDLAAAYKSMMGLRLRTDVIPVTRSEFEEGRHLWGSLAQIATTEGRPIYGPG